MAVSLSAVLCLLLLKAVLPVLLKTGGNTGLSMCSLMSPVLLSLCLSIHFGMPILCPIIKLGYIDKIQGVPKNLHTS